MTNRNELAIDFKYERNKTMTTANKAQTASLRERIDTEYDNFKETILQLDKDKIFILAPMIAAAHDVCFYMHTHEWADADETEYLLGLTDPFRFLCDAWEENMEDKGKEFGKVLAKAVALSDYGFYTKYGDEGDVNNEYEENGKVNNT